MPSSCYQVKLTNHITQWPSEQLSSLPWYIDICHDHLSMSVLVIGEIDLSSRHLYSSSCVAMQCTWCKYFLLYTKFRHGHRVLPTSSSSSSSLLSWRLTCQLKPAVVSGGDHRGTINRRQGPSSRGRISLTCNWPWVPANQTHYSYFFLKRIELWTW